MAFYSNFKYLSLNLIQIDYFSPGLACIFWLIEKLKFFISPISLLVFPKKIKLIRAGSSQNFTVFISLLAPFPFAFGALFTVAGLRRLCFWNTLNPPRTDPAANNKLDPNKYSLPKFQVNSSKIGSSRAMSNSKHKNSALN